MPPCLENKLSTRCHRVSKRNFLSDMKRYCFFVMCALLSSCSSIDLSGIPSSNGFIEVESEGISIPLFVKPNGRIVYMQKPFCLYKIPVSKGVPIEKSLRFFFHHWSDLDVTLYSVSIGNDGEYQAEVSSILSNGSFCPCSTKGIQIENDKIIITDEDNKQRIAETLK